MLTSQFVGWKVQSECGLVVVWCAALRNANWTVAIQWLRWRRALLVHLQWNSMVPSLHIRRGNRDSQGGKIKKKINPFNININKCNTFQLLEKDYTKRIGSQYSPAGDIADHIFFRPIDWGLLEKRQIEPPFKPQVVSDLMELLLN